MKTLLFTFACVAALAAFAPPAAPAVGAIGADALRAQYAALARRLAVNQFSRPLVLDSHEGNQRVQGDIYALVDYPFQQVRANMGSAQRWCEVMLLHINTKYCHPVAEAGKPTVLRLYVGKKTPQDLADADRLEFSYLPLAAGTDYFETVLDAPQGPLGTSGYRIALRAVAVDGGRTFLHLGYGYDLGFAARLATRAYLGTLGRDKVGFTVTGKGADGRDELVGGVRGIVERNTMRYYLAIDAYLAAARSGPGAQMEASLQNWFNASEAYARQLHEMDRGPYLAMKRAEYARQQVLR